MLQLFESESINVFAHIFSLGVMDCRRSLFWLIWICSFVAGQTPTQYELKGKEAKLIPAYFGQPENILWKHNGNKVVEFTGSVEEVYDPFINRVTLNWESAELSIKNLNLNDSGFYEVEVDVKNKLKRSSHTLVVMDRVSKPTITCQMTNSNNSTISDIQAVLVCSTETGSSQSFEWRSVGKVQPGAKLTIPLGEKHNDEVYNCSVSNPVSEDMATFTAKNCYPTTKDTSAPWFIPVIVILSLLVLLLVLLLVFGFVFRKRLKACFGKGQQVDEEKQEMKHGQGGQNAGRQGGQNAETQGGQNVGTQGIANGQSMETQDETPEKGTVGQKRGYFEELNIRQNGGWTGTNSAKRNRESEQEADEDEERDPLLGSGTDLTCKVSNMEHGDAANEDKKDSNAESGSFVSEETKEPDVNNRMKDDAMISPVEASSSQDPESENDADKDEEKQPLLGSGAAPGLTCNDSNKEQGDAANEDKKDSDAETESLDSKETKEPDDTIKSPVEASSSLQDPGIENGQKTETQDATPEKGYVKHTREYFEAKANTGQNNVQTGTNSATKKRESEQEADEDEERDPLLGSGAAPDLTCRDSNMEHGDAANEDNKDSDAETEFFDSVETKEPDVNNTMKDDAIISPVEASSSLQDPESDKDEEKQPLLGSGAAPDLTCRDSNMEHGDAANEDKKTETQDATPEKGNVKRNTEYFDAKANTGQSNVPTGTNSATKKRGSEYEADTLKVTEAVAQPYPEKVLSECSEDAEDVSSKCSEDAASDKVTEEEPNVTESHLLHGDSLEEEHSDPPPAGVRETPEKDTNTHINTPGPTPETHASVSKDESKSDDPEECSKGQNLSESPGIHTKDAAFIAHGDQEVTDEGENTRESHEERSQSDGSRAEGDKGEDRNQAQTGPPEKEPETLREDTEGQNNAAADVVV